MNTLIISGSNRADSGSRKVADYLEQCISELSGQSTILDMHEIVLPLWTEDIFNPESEQSKNWSQYAQQIQWADSVAIVAAEWHGSIPPSLQNILTHLSRAEVGHKPTLLVSVSAGIGGTYPIAQLKSFANKNNRMLFTPDHVIVRNIREILNDTTLVRENARDYEAKIRLMESCKELAVYAKHMAALREEITFDYEAFANGM